jgi:hypothetical protein
MRLAGLALALTLVGACSSAGAAKAAAPVDRASEELDILETLFLYQFEHHFAVRSADHYDYLFLSLPGKQDPPALLLSRFAGQSPPVEAASAAAAERWMGIHHKEKGGRGILFRVDHLRWIDDGAVEVDGGFYEASRDSSNTLLSSRATRWGLGRRERQDVRGRVRVEFAPVRGARRR